MIKELSAKGSVVVKASWNETTLLFLTCRQAFLMVRKLSSDAGSSTLKLCIRRRQYVRPSRESIALKTELSYPTWRLLGELSSNSGVKVWYGGRDCELPKLLRNVFCLLVELLPQVLWYEGVSRLPLIWLQTCYDPTASQQSLMRILWG